MSEIGYYRYKFDNLSKGDHTAFLLINGEYAAEKHITIKQVCGDSKYIKYLNSTGQYRFIIFNSRWDMKDSPVSLGNTNELITNIFNAQSTIKSLGYKNSKILNVILDEVTDDELIVLSEVNTSPNVFLYVGTGSGDSKSDWVQVSVKNKNNLNKLKKAKFSKFEIEITMPDNFTINRL